MGTKTFVKRIVDFSFEKIPENVVHEAKRSLLNFLSVAIGSHEFRGVKSVLEVAEVFGGEKQATVIGTPIKATMEYAAICNGMTSSLFDYDDTLMDTIIHPSCPVFPALFAWAEKYGMTGDQLLRYFVLGVEVEERMGLFVGKPGHYDKGWHMTGTMGTFGATAAIGRVLGLNEAEMVQAMALASTQPTGMRVHFGTEVKPLHAGKAAANGMLSAMLAQYHPATVDDYFENKIGYGLLMSDSPDYEYLKEEWNGYKLMENTYKPYACAVVIFPAIDGAIRLFNKGIKPEDIESIELEVYYLAVDITDRPTPKNHLEAVVSIYHGFAAGLLRGRAGLKEYDDDFVTSEEVVNIRKKIRVVKNMDMKTDQCRVNVVLKNGEKFSEFVEHNRGSIALPLTDADLEEKFRLLTEDYLSPEKQDRVIDLVWNFDKQKSVDELVKSCISDRYEK